MPSGDFGTSSRASDAERMISVSPIMRAKVDHDDLFSGAPNPAAAIVQQQSRIAMKPRMTRDILRAESRGYQAAETDDSMCLGY